jgi:hypothetical protein
MFGEEVLMAPGQGFHLRGLQRAARALGEIREVHSGTPCYVPALDPRRGKRRLAARPMRDRSAPKPQMVRRNNSFKPLNPLGFAISKTLPLAGYRCGFQAKEVYDHER